MFAIIIMLLVLTTLLVLFCLLWNCLRSLIHQRLANNGSGEIDRPLLGPPNNEPARAEPRPIPVQNLIEMLIALGHLQVVDRRPRGDPNISESEIAGEELAGEECAVCQDPLSLRNIIRLPACQHLFHSNCIRRWCIENPTCPVCRTNIYRPEDIRQEQ